MSARAASALTACAALLLAACGTAPKPSSSTSEAAKPQTPAPGSKYYKDDGPPENAPADLAALPDAQPRAEPLHRFANRPYMVFGQEYVPMGADTPYKAQGVASWYGKKFHGQKTSNGEIYDMFAMTAAHKTLPLPSYARVTNPANGKSVVVRVNDRGPFHADRIIDLSYAAATKLGVASAGSGVVDVERLFVPAGGSVIAAAPPPATLGATAAASAPPAAIATESPATPPVSAAPDAPGWFVQLGAFSTFANADSFRAHLKAQLDWLAEPINIAPRDQLFRVRLGPYKTESEARTTSQKLADALGLKPVINHSSQTK